MDINKSNPITRLTILNDIGFTEEQIKQGISINDILPFFEKIKISIKSL